MVPAEPLKIVAGDTAQWERSVADFPPAGGWALTYYLTKAPGQPIPIQATPGPLAFLVEVPAATTAAWAPGMYHWTAVVTKAGTRKTVDQGTLEVTPNPASALDLRTHEERVLDSLTAALEGRASETILEQTVGNTPIKFMDTPTLVRLQAHYRALVRVQHGGSFVTQIPVRLTRD